MCQDIIMDKFSVKKIQKFTKKYPYNKIKSLIKNQIYLQKKNYVLYLEENGDKV